MRKFLPLFLAFVLLTLASKSQSVTGTLMDSGDRSPIANATVKLLKPDSTVTSFMTVSNAKGIFNFRNVPNGNYIVEVSSVSYSKYHKAFSAAGENTNLGNMGISKNAETLSTVIIDGAPPVRQRNDTLEYSASQYKLNPDATSEDLIKKMPGVTVDKSGAVTAQGETVRKVTVDGRDFFGDDATATLRNLPAEIIDKIQVFDKLSDQAQLTGFDDGNTTKSINIVTKADMRSGNFGRAYAGYGTDERYSAGGNISFFNNARRISLVALVNNVNQQNFSSQDLLGVTGAGGRGGGGGQRGGMGGGGGNFNVGQQSGIAKTNAFGINYSDAWGKKIDVSGSYFFNNSNTSNNQTLNQQNIISQDTSSFYDENSFTNSKNFNNRVNFRMNYKIDTRNTILVTSSISFQKNNSFNSVRGYNYNDALKQILSSQTENDLTSDNNGFNINNSVMYSHAFLKKGRSISLRFGTTFSDREGHNYLNASNEFYLVKGRPDTSVIKTNSLTNSSNNTNQYNINLIYTEPVGKKGQLQFNYNPAFQTSTADQRYLNFDDGSGKYSKLDASLSNVFENTYNTQNTGVTYRLGDRDNMLSFGLSYQYGELKSNQIYPETGHIDNSYSNLLPNVMGRIKFSARSNIRVFYRASVNPPSVNQLQNVINTSNQFFYTTGNPDLQQQYTNNLVTRYTYTNAGKGQSFFANLSLSNTKNYVANASYTSATDSILTPTLTLRPGQTISKPVNLDGYLSARSFFTFGMPLKFIKSNLNWNAGVSYTRLPGLVNTKMNNGSTLHTKNISNTYNYNLGAVLASNINEYIDFTLSYSANINTVENTQLTTNNDYLMQQAGLTLNLLSKKGAFFQNDLSNQTYSGLSGGLNQSYWLWNMSLGQKFLKNQDGELKLTVFDLLKQNKSISRDLSINGRISDYTNQVLQQYFMLTFTYKLKTFGKGKATSNQGERRFGGMPFGGGGPGGYPL